MLYGRILHGQMLHGQMLHRQMSHGQMWHGQMFYGQLHQQILHGQMVLGRLSTVKDGSKNLKCPPRYFPWGRGVGGEKLKLMLTQSSCAGAGTELGNEDKMD